jgi:hypothetical protein
MTPGEARGAMQGGQDDSARKIVQESRLKMGDGSLPNPWARVFILLSYLGCWRPRRDLNPRYHRESVPRASVVKSVLDGRKRLGPFLQALPICLNRPKFARLSSVGVPVDFAPRDAPDNGDGRLGACCPTTVQPWKTRRRPSGASPGERRPFGVRLRARKSLFRIHARRSVQRLKKRLPLLWRSDKSWLIRKRMFRLQASAFKDKVRDTDTSCLRPDANQSFLTLCRTDVEPPRPMALAGR